MSNMSQPKQARSQATYDKLLDAAQEIMLTKNYESVSIEEICDHAGLTSGAFYGRFSNKATLLTALSERTNEHIEELFSSLEDWATKKRSLSVRMRKFVHELDAFYVEYKGVLRCIRRSAATNSELQERATQLNNQMKSRIIDYLRPCLGEVTHKNKVQALEVSLTIIYSTLRMQSVEDDLFPQEFLMPKKRLLPALSDSIVSYLTQ